MKVVTADPKETARVAADFAKKMKGGEVVALIGDLGAGKTTFVQAFAKALGVRERVSSPTFVLMHEHHLAESTVNGQRSTVRALVHADAYRADAAQFRNIGIEEYFGAPGTVVLIEWADRVEALLPKKRLTIRFRHLGGDRREIVVPS